MKLTSISSFCLGLSGAFYIAQAEVVNLPGSSGPETTLDSIWAASAYLHTLADTVAAQRNMARFQDESNHRLWGSGMASFGDASVRNYHPSFDYSAGGYALGYDYSQYKREGGFIVGLALGQMFGHQNIDEMPDHQDGLIPGDRYSQVSFGVDAYGAMVIDLTPKSHLIFSLDAGFGYMTNKCQHHGEWNDMSKWSTDTCLVSFSTAWRYDITESLGIMPFTKLSYTRASNKKEKEGYTYCSHDYGWGDDYWDDDYCDEERWDNRGKYDNLALEIGLALEHTLRFSEHSAWINSVSGSYCPDILRNNPHYTFNDTWTEEGTDYQSKYRGSGYPAARQAFKIGGMSRFAYSEGLSFFASYQISLRESYTEQQAALGVSVHF